MTICDIAVMVPCYNEEKTIADVVNKFRAAIPQATVYVYDNNSNDRTVEMALSSGAIVKKELLQGKGNVVRRMFADIEADIYILVDGDGTYNAECAKRMISHLIENQLDMVNGKRVSIEKSAYRKGHRLGNALMSKIVQVLFGNRITDLFSGYRAFSRRFVKSFPALSLGFEIETELTVHALDLRMPVSEVETPYYSRPKGSFSKLNTYSDGLRILLAIFNMVKYERPLAFFLSLFALLFCISMGFFWPVLTEYLNTGLVPRIPTTLLSTALMLLAFLCLLTGLILDNVTQGRRELKRLNYLNLPSLELTASPTFLPKKHVRYEVG